jgi:hypothetical protein
MRVAACVPLSSGWLLRVLARTSKQPRPTNGTQPTPRNQRRHQCTSHTRAPRAATQAPRGAFIIPDIVSACRQGYTNGEAFDPDRFRCAVTGRLTRAWHAARASDEHRAHTGTAQADRVQPVPPAHITRVPTKPLRTPPVARTNTHTHAHTHTHTHAHTRTRRAAPSARKT